MWVPINLAEAGSFLYSRPNVTSTLAPQGRHKRGDNRI